FRRANDGAAKTYDEARSYYIGGNWYIDGDNLKLTFGYEFADYEANGGEDADVDGLRARLQILF
ncbi:MAG: porin, partial [bacterium]